MGYYYVMIIHQAFFAGFPDCPWFFSRDSPPGITLELALELTRWPGNKNNPSSPSGRSVCELKVWCNIQWSLGYSTYIYICIYTQVIQWSLMIFQWQLMIFHYRLIRGLEHEFYFPKRYGNFIIQTDEFIFFRGVDQPPTRYIYILYIHILDIA
jgi:hypothetical protein